MMADCAPPSSTTCDNATDKLTVCDATGRGTVTTCALGCHATEERCTDVDPSNNLAAYLDMTSTAADVTLPDGSQIDTMTGTITTPTGTLTVPSATVTQTGAPTIRVFITKAITLNDVTISGTNALAIVSDGLATIQGTVSAAAIATTAGPGAATCTLATGLGGEGVHPGTSNANWRGGGGGGFGTAGARGGHVSGTNGGAAGAAVSTAAATTLVPLRGGCKGGGSQHPDQAGTVNVGAAGGGAVQIVSRTQISIVANTDGTGVINVGGGGGPAGPSNPTGEQGGGGGGGSGGGVLLEAPLILVTGTGTAIAANGGGGGSGCLNRAGANGRIDGTPTAGGSAAACSAEPGRTSGGAGAVSVFNSSAVAAVEGVDSTSAAEPRAAGGGGGGAGRIRINNASGTFSVGAGAGLYGVTTVAAIGKR